MRGISAPGKPSFSPQLVLRLQKTSGNRTVQRLLARHATLRATNALDGRRSSGAPAKRGPARFKRWLSKLLRRGHNGDEGT
jgi:hypothetical protein